MVNGRGESKVQSPESKVKSSGSLDSLGLQGSLSWTTGLGIMGYGLRNDVFAHGLEPCILFLF